MSQVSDSIKDSDEQSPAQPGEGLFPLIVDSGPWVFQTLYVAAKLGLADLLAEGARSADELAAASGAHAPTLRRFCRGLAVLGILTEPTPGAFALTPMGLGLKSDAPGGSRQFLILNGEPHLRAWEAVMHTVLTGECAFEHVHGKRYFDFLAEDKDAEKVFNQLFGNETPPAIVNQFDFSAANVIVDLGGGIGALLVQILAGHDHVRGILQDLPSATAGALDRAASHGVAERFEVRTASFFEDIVPGGDVYMLSRVLHDWDDETALRLLRRIRQSIPAESVLLVIDEVIPAGPESKAGRLSDLQMLVVVGGQERTEEEIQELLREAGFRVAEVKTPATKSSSVRAESMVVARPA